MIDCHAHINSEEFDKDRAEVLRAAEKNGADAILDSGTNLKENKKVLELAKQFKILKPSLGWQPNQLNKKAAQENLKFIKETTKQFVAIGEIGLDYWFRGSELPTANRKLQTEIFKMHIELAKELGLPIVTHSPPPPKK